MPAPINLTGKRFGKLVAIAPDTSRKLRQWSCLCDCGNETTVPTNKITSGHTQSCGCYKAYTTITNGFKNHVHGLGHGNSTPTYRTWNSMKQRCAEHYPARARYFDRGITVCERWSTYANFVEDMGERPLNTTLDRIDVDGNYNVGNCRWASHKQQQRNKTNTNYLYFKGVRHVAMDIADEIGVKGNAMKYFVSVARKMVEKYGYIPDIKSS